MANNKTLSERIVDSAGTGKSDPAELDVLTGGELGVLDGATAGTAVASKAVVLDANKGVANIRDTSNVQIFKQQAPATATATATLTTTQILTGLILATPAAAVNYTLPLASALETALLVTYPGLSADDAFEFSIQNLSTTDTQDITILTNTGWTIPAGTRVVIESNSNTTIATATAATFRVRRTAANAYTLYRVAG